MAFPVDEAGPSDPFLVEKEEPSAYDVAKSYDKLEYFYPPVDIQFSETRDESYDSINRMALTVAKILEQTLDDGAEFLSVYGAKAIREFLKLSESSGNFEDYHNSIKEFSQQAYKYYESDQAFEDLSWSAKATDTNPQMLREEFVYEISKLEAKTKVLGEKGMEFFFKQTYILNQIQKFTLLENELAVDAAAQEKDIYEDAIRPLFINHALPNIIDEMFQSQQETNQVFSDPFYALSAFYGSIVYLRRCMKEESVKEQRELLLQIIRNSDIEEAAVDLEDLTPDGEVPKKVSAIAAFAYVLSAEKDFQQFFDPEMLMSQVELEMTVFEIVKKNFPHQETEDTEEIKKGRKAMLVRLATLFQLSNPNGVINVQKFENDVKYQQAFDVMNDILTDDKYRGFTSSMVQHALESFLIGIIRDFKTSVDTEDMIKIWNTVVNFSGIALYYHSAFEKPISASVDMFTDEDLKKEWFRYLFVFVGKETQARQIESQLFHNVDLETIDFDIFEAVFFVFALATVGYDLYQKFKKSTMSKKLLSFLEPLVYSLGGSIGANALYSGAKAYRGWNSAIVNFRSVIVDINSLVFTPFRLQEKTANLALNLPNTLLVTVNMTLLFELIIATVTFYSWYHGGNKRQTVRGLSTSFDRKNKKNLILKLISNTMSITKNIAGNTFAFLASVVAANPATFAANTFVQSAGISVPVALVGLGLAYSTGYLDLEGAATAGLQNVIIEYAKNFLDAGLTFFAKNITFFGFGSFSLVLAGLSQFDPTPRGKEIIYTVSLVAAYSYLGSSCLFADLFTGNGELDFINPQKVYHPYLIANNPQGFTGAVLSTVALSSYAMATATVWGFFTDVQTKSQGFLKAKPPPLKKIQRYQKRNQSRLRIENTNQSWSEKAKGLGRQEIQETVAEIDELIENAQKIVSESVENIVRYQNN